MAAAAPTNQKGFTWRTLPNWQRLSRHRADTCGRLRERLAVLAAARRAWDARPRMRPVATAAIVHGRFALRGLGRAGNSTPHDPQEPRDGDLQHEHHPDEGPGQVAGWYPRS